MIPHAHARLLRNRHDAFQQPRQVVPEFLFRLCFRIAGLFVGFGVIELRRDGTPTHGHPVRPSPTLPQVVTQHGNPRLTHGFDGGDVVAQFIVSAGGAATDVVGTYGGHGLIHGDVEARFRPLLLLLAHGRLILIGANVVQRCRGDARLDAHFPTDFHSVWMVIGASAEDHG